MPQVRTARKKYRRSDKRTNQKVDRRRSDKRTNKKVDRRRSDKRTNKKVDRRRSDKRTNKKVDRRRSDKRTNKKVDRRRNNIDLDGGAIDLTELQKSSDDHFGLNEKDKLILQNYNLLTVNPTLKSDYRKDYHLDSPNYNVLWNHLNILPPQSNSIGISDKEY